MLPMSPKKRLIKVFSSDGIINSAIAQTTAPIIMEWFLGILFLLMGILWLLLILLILLLAIYGIWHAFAWVLKTKKYTFDYCFEKLFEYIKDNIKIKIIKTDD